MCQPSDVRCTFIEIRAHEYLIQQGSVKEFVYYIIVNCSFHQAVRILQIDIQFRRLNKSFVFCILNTYYTKEYSILNLSKTPSFNDYLLEELCVLKLILHFKLIFLMRCSHADCIVYTVVVLQRNRLPRFSKLPMEDM